MFQAVRVVLCLGIALGAGTIAITADASMGSMAPHNPVSPANAQQNWVADPRTDCKALDTDYAAGDYIQWQGTCVGALASGTGTLTFANNGHVLETIAGNFGNGILLPGRVSAVWADGSKYDGNQQNGQFDGMGDFVSSAGDKISGQWRSGALNGKASVSWANGDRYDGTWKSGKPDGQGTEVWANGDRFEGLWNDGSPIRQTAPAQVQGVSASLTPAPAPAVAAEIRTPTANDVPAAPQVTPAVAAPQVTPAVATPRVMPAVATPQDVPVQDKAAVLPMQDFFGKTLVAVDGSTIGLSEDEGGLTRMVTLSNGASQQISFAFMSDRIGTVSNDAAAIGLFRVKGDEIDTNYIDGKTEIMKPGSGGGILLTLHSPDGNSSCSSWYPEGHAFSQEEKRAAVEAYATRLGVGGSAPPKKHHVAHVSGTQTCGGGFVTTVDAGAQASPDALSPKQDATPSAVPAANPAQEGSKPADALQTIPVKDSTVHLIDAPYEVAPGGKPLEQVKFGADAPSLQAVAPAPSSQTSGAQPVSNASQCLSVAINGQYWGFQNRCGTAVQFAYCEMSEANPLTSCHHTSVSGSVAANGFSALINASSLSGQGANHEFRWMACDGGAGEVVPHLDSADPPSGRCLRAVPAASTASPNSAGS